MIELSAPPPTTSLYATVYGSPWGFAVIALLVAISISDCLWRTVSNHLVVVGLCIGICLRAAQQGPWGAMGFLAASFACLLVGIVFWALGFVGGADAKVFAVYGGLTGLDRIFEFALGSAIFAGLLGGMALFGASRGSLADMFNSMSHPQGALTRARRNGDTMPLTVALSGGVVGILCGGA